MCVRASAASPVGLFIHKGGRWLRLDVSGRLQGERRRPRFFYLRRGQLKEVRTRRVLRQLEAARGAGPPLLTTRRRRTASGPEEWQSGPAAIRAAEEQAPDPQAVTVGPAPSERPEASSAPARRSPHGVPRARLTRAQLTQVHSNPQAAIRSHANFAPLLLTACSPQTPITKPKQRHQLSSDSEAKSKSSRELSPILSKPGPSRTKRVLQQTSKNVSAPTTKTVLKLKSQNALSTSKITRRSKKQAHNASSSSPDEPKKLKPKSSPFRTNEIVHIPSVNVLKRARSVGDKRNYKNDAWSSGDEFVRKRTSITRQTRANLRRSTSEDTLHLLDGLKLIPASQLPERKPGNSRKLRQRPAANAVKSFEISSDEESTKKSQTGQKTSRRDDTTSDKIDATKKLRVRPISGAKNNSVEVSGKPGPFSTKTLRAKQNSSQRNNPTNEITKTLRSGLDSAQKRLRVISSSESSDDQAPVESKMLRSTQKQSNSREVSKEAMLRSAKRRRLLGSSDDSLSMTSWDGGRPAYTSSPRRSPCKELFMSESDVEAVAGWLARAGPARFGPARPAARSAARPPYDADKFRADEVYRTKVLFLLQPLVYCGRHWFITSSSRPGQRLRISGGRTASGSESEMQEGSDKENRARERDRRDDKRKRDLKSERDGKRAAARKPERDGNTAAAGPGGGGARGRGHVTSRPRPQHFPPPHPRAFSALEDRAIVDYIQQEGLALEVNGNTLWKRLQTEWQAICGKPRSWHSLRNRYLRYLLPSLHSLALSPRQAQRLRAAAATGSLKLSRKRRNSLLRPAPAPAPAPASAWSRRPRPQLDTTPADEPAADSIPRTGRRGLLPMSYL